jgi:hypothetical protein
VWELAFASLHPLCGPLLDRLEGLPAPQRQAVEIVFGLTAGEAPDRFRITPRFEPIPPRFRRMGDRLGRSAAAGRFRSGRDQVRVGAR